MGLLAKACKQYRAVCELSQMGLGDPTDGVARMMFETLLAVSFLLRKQVDLTVQGQPLIVEGGKQLTPTFRGQLYAANDAFQAQKILNGATKAPGLLCDVPASSQSRFETNVANYKTMLGPAWTKLVMRKGYAGIHVSDLAESLGFSEIYASVYKIASGGVHAADAMNHVVGQCEDLNDFHFMISPNPENVPTTLNFASRVMVTIIQEANDRFGFGLEQRAENLMTKLGEMSIEFPED